ncbi:MAG: hypothetical protein Q9190_001365 [Brigantiaea leucoxantha]
MVKTYSRPLRRAVDFDDLEFPRKKIRLDSDAASALSSRILSQEEDVEVPVGDPLPSSSTAPSSPQPSDPACFSDPVPGTDRSSESPPSSPPPALPPPAVVSKKPAFSFLKRKRPTQEDEASSPLQKPLADLPPNIQRTARPGKRTRMTQMQIDLGGEVRKACKICGMEYIPSNREDLALHRDFHSMNVDGVNMGKAFQRDYGLKRVSPANVHWLEEGVEILLVDRRSPLAVKNKVKKVLEIVKVDLSAAEIEDKQLWAGLEQAPERTVTTRKAKGDMSDKKADRFKAFLYLKGDQCVGFCLAEKITKAHRVMDTETKDNTEETTVPLSRSSSISISPDVDVALLGISRIWTSKSHRGEGIARELLETARSNFFYGLEVPKDLVAFSQPTESGGRLARKWYNQTAGWHVYREA